MAVPPSLIHKIEGGRIPVWPVLAALPRAYDVPTEEMFRRLFAALTYAGAEEMRRRLRQGQSGVTLSGDSPAVPAEVETALHPAGGAHAAASSRLQPHQLQALADEIYAATDRLNAVAISLVEDSKAAGAPPRRTGGPGKTR